MTSRLFNAYLRRFLRKRINGSDSRPLWGPGEAEKIRRQSRRGRYLWEHICQKVWTKASGGERTTPTQRINSVYNTVVYVILPFGVSLDLYPSCSTVAKEMRRRMAKLKAVEVVVEVDHNRD